MANKRVSELSLITAAEVAPNDLLLVADVSAIESKRMYLSQLGTYVSTFVSASMSASTAQNATYARTASYLIGIGLVNGTPALGTASYAISSSHDISSSHAIWADTASYALAALSASYASSSSYCQTASFAYTSSYVVITQYSSAYANYANTASYLIGITFSDGTPALGTASYALMADSSTTAFLATYANNLQYAGIPNGTAYNSIISKTSSCLFGPTLADGTAALGTASYALTASTAKTASYIRSSNLSASYLRYTDGVPNGTAYNSITASYVSLAVSASHALTASYLLGFSGVSSNNYSEGGPYAGTVYSPSLTLGAATASFGTLTINPTDNVAKNTIIECWGSVTSLTLTSPPDLRLRLTQGATVTELDATYLRCTGSAEWHFKVSTTLLGSWQVNVFNINRTDAIMTDRIPRMYIKTLADNWSVT